MSSTGISLVSAGSASPHLTYALPTPHVDDFDSAKSSNEVRINAGITVVPRVLHIRENIVEKIGDRLLGNYQLLQQWEGYVIAVLNKEMLCRIIDKTNPDNPEEEVTIPLRELEPSELSLVKPGAVFYWSIRYADQYGRGRTRESLIRFRRLPPIKKIEMEKTKRRAAYLEEFFSRT